MNSPKMLVSQNVYLSCFPVTAFPQAWTWPRSLMHAFSKCHCKKSIYFWGKKILKKIIRTYEVLFHLQSDIWTLINHCPRTGTYPIQRSVPGVTWETCKDFSQHTPSLWWGWEQNILLHQDLYFLSHWAAAYYLYLKSRHVCFSPEFTLDKKSYLLTYALTDYKEYVFKNRKFQK